MSNALLKAEAHATYRNYVQAALAAAHLAADRMAASYPDEQTECLMDVFASRAVVTVDRPSYRLRKVLKEIDELVKYGVNWFVSSDWGHTTSRQHDLHDQIGDVAARELSARLAEDGQFSHFVGAGFGR